MAWKITTKSGKSYNQATISAGVYNAVAEVLNDASWSQLEPTVGPRQLIAWLAILEADESNDKDVMSHLTEVMQRPMVEVITALQLSSDQKPQVT
jgi:hypothetical protein